MKFPAYPKYKASGVEWLGDVPEHWNVCAVWHLFSLGRGRVISHEDIGENPGEYPVYSSQTENDGVLGSLSTYDFEGDFVTWTTDGANAGTVFRRTGRFNCTNVCGTLKPKSSDRIDTRFASYALNLATDEFVRHDINPKLMNNVMAKIRFGVASLTEQQAIAAFLDRETGRFDWLVAKKRELIERLKEKRTALISRTVTRGLPPAAARAAGLPENPPLKPSGVAWLDDVPEHWKVSKLKHIKASIPNAFVDGPFGSNLKTEHFVSDGDVFVIESGFATRGKLNEETLKTIEMEHFLTIKRSSTFPGDIIIAKIGAYFGLNHVLPPLAKPAVVSGNSLKLTVDHESCSAAYFHYQRLHLKWCGAIDLLANITAQPALSLGEMNTLSCIQPPLPEQTAIAAYLDAETAKLDALVAKVEAAIERLQEYRTALITAAVTGKIDVRNSVASVEANQVCSELR